MKKGLKICLKVLLTLLAVILTIIAVLAIYISAGSNQAKTLDNYDGEELSTWMSNVDNETLVKDIVIPGSHDAGTESMFYAGRTQKYSIKDQLKRGARYFDIRVNKNNDELVIFHSILNGDKYVNVLNEIREFIFSNPSEGLILDFQHFKNDAMEESLDLLEFSLGEDKLVYNFDSSKSDVEFINSLNMGDLRGKCLITVGSTEAKSKFNFAFVRDEDMKERENSVLHSYYESSYHYMDSKSFIENGLPAYIDLRKKNLDGLFVLQCQLTDNKFIFGPAFRESGHQQNIAEYIFNLSESSDLSYINIIMRDFLDVFKTQAIITLNNYKNSVWKEGYTFKI